MSLPSKLATFIGLLFFVYANIVWAMSSTNYGILWDSVNSGGTDASSSTSFGLYDTLGEQSTGVSSSTSYSVSAGYRAGDSTLGSATISFVIGTQENSTEVPYTAFSSTTVDTVTVNSASGYAVGNLIGVVENKGLAEKISTGVITSIAGNVLTVDHWDGVPALMSASPSGGDDFVYRMQGHAVDFGELIPNSPVTSLTGTRISTNAANGYTITVNSDGDLRYGASSTIANVSDGLVSIGSEEYGWQVFGSFATSTGADLAFATSTTVIQRSSVSGDAEGVGLVYKINTTPTTRAGNYVQHIFYTATANF